MNTLATQERLTESELPGDVFGASAETQPQQQQPQQLDAEQQEQDHSKSPYLPFLHKNNYL